MDRFWQPGDSLKLKAAYLELIIVFIQKFIKQNHSTLGSFVPLDKGVNDMANLPQKNIRQTFTSKNTHKSNSTLLLLLNAANFLSYWSNIKHT